MSVTDSKATDYHARFLNEGRVQWTASHAAGDGEPTAPMDPADAQAIVMSLLDQFPSLIEQFPTATTATRRRDDLLADAARKPVKRFRQFDVFPGVGPDMNPPANDEGDQMFCGLAWELRNGTPVRVQVEPDVTPEAAVRALRLAADSIEADRFELVDSFATETECPF
jgi:hypothetical protein